MKVVFDAPVAAKGTAVITRPCFLASDEVPNLTAHLVLDGPLAEAHTCHTQLGPCVALPNPLRVGHHDVCTCFLAAMSPLGFRIGVIVTPFHPMLQRLTDACLNVFPQMLLIVFDRQHIIAATV